MHKFNSNVAMVLNSPFLSQTLWIPLLQIVSHIEVAVLSFKLVKPAPNLEEWKQHFDEEKFSTVIDWPCYTLIPI
jgi:hypothetical protein